MSPILYKYLYTVKYNHYEHIKCVPILYKYLYTVKYNHYEHIKCVRKFTIYLEQSLSLLIALK